MVSYEDLLKKGMKKVPKKVVETGRFEVPKAQAMKEGNKTVITNLFEVANALRRDTKHLVKFLSLELGTSYDIKNNRVYFIGNFSSEQVNKKIEIYIKNYVTCSDCYKPDTKLIEESGVFYIRCEACGAKHQVKKI